MKRRLGRTDLQLFPIGLGAMPLSIEGRPDERQSIAVIHAAIAAGVDLIDTANVYCLDDNDIGHNELLIRKALDSFPGGAKQVLVATKGGLRRPKGDWVTEGSPKSLRAACEKSLLDLGVEAITLYQLHAPDDRIPFEDSVGELARLQKEGKIVHLGLSNVNEDELEAALHIARIESVQNRCNPFDQSDIRNRFIERCASHGITYLAYSPVGGGNGHKLLAQNTKLRELTQKYDATPYMLTLAWLLSKGPNVIPIPGASRVSSIESSVRAASLSLSAEDIATIDRLSPF